jgi:hypothetical protein
MIQNYYNNQKSKAKTFIENHKTKIWFYPAVSAFIVYEVLTKGACVYFACESFKKPLNPSPSEVVARNMNIGLDSLVINTNVSATISSIKK